MLAEVGQAFGRPSSIGRGRVPGDRPNPDDLSVSQVFLI